MYNCVIFDIDGTILDTKEASLIAIQQAYYLESGKRLSFEELDPFFGITNINISKALGIKDIDVFIQNIDAQYDLHSDKNHIFPGMEEVIHSLFAQNIFLGIVTSKTIWEYEHDFEEIFNLAHYFRRAMCVEHTNQHKPHPEPLNAFFRLTGQEKATALYIGDTINDSMCAQDAGVDFALAKWGASGDIPAKYILEKPEDIYSIL